LTQSNLTLTHIFDQNLNINSFPTKILFFPYKIKESGPVTVLTLKTKSNTKSEPNNQNPTLIETERPYIGQKLTFYGLEEGKLNIKDAVVTGTNLSTYDWRGFKIYGPVASPLPELDPN
jgi:hypothetical protein